DEDGDRGGRPEEEADGDRQRGRVVVPSEGGPGGRREEEVERAGDPGERQRGEPPARGGDERVEQDDDRSHRRQDDLRRDRGELVAAELHEVHFAAIACFCRTVFCTASMDGARRERTSLGRTPIQTMSTTRTAAATNSVFRISGSERFSSWTSG